MSNEEKHEFIFYRYIGDGSNKKQFLCLDTFLNYCRIGLDLATLYTKKEAENQFREIIKTNCYDWQYCHYQDLGGVIEGGEPQYAPKVKRKAFIICAQSNGKKIYLNTPYKRLSGRPKGYSCDLFRTYEDAEFQCYALNMSKTANGMLKR